MRIVVAIPFSPWPVRKGTDRLNMNLIEGLSVDHEVILVHQVLELLAVHVVVGDVVAVGGDQAHVIREAYAAKWFPRAEVHTLIPVVDVVRGGERTPPIATHDDLALVRPALPDQGDGPIHGGQVELPHHPCEVIEIGGDGELRAVR